MRKTLARIHSAGVSLTLGAGLPVSGVGSTRGVDFTFKSDHGLAAGTTYAARIEEVTDLAGNALSGPFEWLFTTE